MAVVTTIYITHSAENLATISALVKKDTTLPKVEVQSLATLMEAIGSGNVNAKLEVHTDAAVTYATGTLTCATVIATNTCAINGVTLTGSATPATQAQFLSTGSNTVVAAAITACINANTNLQGIATATSSGAVVTVQAQLRGLMGNAVSLAGTVTTLAASATALAGGTGITVAPVSYSLGV